MMPLNFADPSYLLVTGAAMLLSWLAGNQLRSKMGKYSRVAMPVTGREVALQMLADAGIHDVQVTAVAGQLTDHYNPANKTVNLSEVVYRDHTLTAAAVAAHEVGHAIQHAKGYAALQFRSAMVPLVQVSSRLSQFVILAGFFVLSLMQSPFVLGIGIALFAVTTLFSLITLPVEFDASKRALAWLEERRITEGQSRRQAKDALHWATMTYVVAAISSLGHLLYLIMVFLRAQSGSQR